MIMLKIIAAPAWHTFRDLVTPVNTIQMIIHRADRMKPTLYGMPLPVDDFHPIVTILIKNNELDCKMNTIIYNFVIQSFQHERSTT